MSKSLGYYNLTGGLNTVQDLITINSSTNRTESPDMMNIEYYKLGGIQTMKGNKQLGNNIQEEPNKDNLTDIICGIEYTIGNESYLLVANRLGTIFEYDKDTKTFVQVGRSFTRQYNIPGDEGSGFNSDFYNKVRIYAVPYNNGIVFVNGKEALFYNREKSELNNLWTPRLTIDDEGTPLTTYFYPVCVASYRGRLFFGANETEQSGTIYKGGMLFYSGVGLGTQEDWYESTNVEGEDAGAFKEFFEDSSSFTGLGTWAEYLVIHKEQNTYLLDGTGELAIDWQLKPYSEYTVPSQQSYVVCNNGYYTYVPEAGGIYSLLQRTIYNNSMQGGDLSYKIRDSFELIDTGNLSKIFAVFHPRKKYIMFYIPTLTSEGSSNCFIYDIQTKTWLYRKVPQNVTCAFRFDNEVYIGVTYTDKEGRQTTKVLKEFSGKTFDGTPIDFYYLTPPFIWGGGTNKTTTKEFRVKMVNSSANHFYIESLKDGLMDTKEQRLVKNVNDNLNGLIWDIGYNLGDRTEENSYNVGKNIYRYRDKEGEYYFSFDYPLTDSSKIYSGFKGIQVNGEPALLLDKDYFNNYYVFFQRDNKVEVQTEQEGNPDLTKVTYQPTYAWNQQVPSDFCYQFDNYYIWVRPDGSSYNNFTKETTYQTQYYAFYGVNWNYGQNGNILATDNLNDANKIINGTTENIKMYIKYGDTFTRLVRMGNRDCYLFTGWGVPYGGVNPTPGYGVSGCFQDSYDETQFKASAFVTEISYSLNQFGNLRLARAGEYDKQTQIITISNNGTLNPTFDSNNNPVVPTGNFIYGDGVQSIQFNLNGTVRTFTRHTAGDKGSTISDTNYWTRELEGTVTLYEDNTTNTALSTVTISNNRFDYNNNTYLRYPQTDGQRAVYKYYVYNNLTYVDIFDERGAELVYAYPEGTEPYEQTLTDTVWDYSDATEYYTADLPTGYSNYKDIPINLRGEAWLQQGYQTKRMLLPNQYFETVQFKFLGGGYDKQGNARFSDSICISGFEVEGIQLAETPWR